MLDVDQNQRACMSFVDFDQQEMTVLTLRAAGAHPDAVFMPNGNFEHQEFLFTRADRVVEVSGGINDGLGVVLEGKDFGFSLRDFSAKRLMVISKVVKLGDGINVTTHVDIEADHIIE